MALREKINEKLVQVLQAHQVQVVEPQAQTLQLNGVLAGAHFSKPRTNMLWRQRGHDTWQVYVDEDFYYLGPDADRRRLFCGAKQARWLALTLEEPILGNLDRAILSGLECIDSPLQTAWRKYGDLREDAAPPRAVVKRLEAFGLVLSAEQLRTPAVRPTPTQADRVACVVATVYRNRSPTCPLILGGAGSGKSTLARLAAARLLEIGVAGRALWVHSASLCAGMIFPPQCDERLGKTLDAALHAEHVLLVLEQFDLLLGHSRVAAALVADALDAGLKMIAVADEVPWRDGAAPWPELRHRVQIVPPVPLSQEEVGMILKARLDEFTQTEPLEAAPELLTVVLKQAAWMPGQNPGAALGLLEAVLAHAALEGRVLIGPDDVYHAIQVYGVSEEA